MDSTGLASRHMDDLLLPRRFDGRGLLGDREERHHLRGSRPQQLLVECAQQFRAARLVVHMVRGANCHAHRIPSRHAPEKLLATRRESYAKSSLSEAARLAYICCECRWEQAEAARIQEVRVEKARHAAEASVAARRRRALKAGTVEINPLAVGLPTTGVEPFPIPAVYAGFEGGFLSTRRPVAPSPRRGGRPRKHPTPRAAKTAAQRAWRTRRRQQAGLSEALARV